MTPRFIEWNELLLVEFFSAAAAGEEVWLHTARDELDSFGLHLGGAEGLVDAVRLGPPWLPRSSSTCAESALVLARQRRLGLRDARYVDPGALHPAYAGFSAPTYLPIVALWVLASSEGGSEGFYAAVNKLLGDPFPNAPRVTDAMQQVWEDLEIWSCQECEGGFGYFRRRILGEHRFVGIPKSQCLVSRSDERGLNRLFWEFRLRPGQHLSDALLEQVVERGTQVGFLSRGLKTAMRDVVYADPTRNLVRRLLATWDGQAPAQVARNDTGTQEQRGGEETLCEITLALSPSEEIADGWDVRWRAPALGSTNHCSILLGTRQVPASIAQTRDFFLTDVTPPAMEVSAATLCSSATAPVVAKILVGDEEAQEVESDVRHGRVSQAVRRLLSWNVPDPRLGEQLVERGVPLYGPLYILCCPSDRGNTEQWLRGEGIAHQDVSTAGLPHGWWMACVERVESLSTDQRHHLSNSAGAADSPLARIRLAGGRPLLRGGSRLYAAYDLPRVEVEAPSGSVLEASGLNVEHIEHIVCNPSLISVRQFSISVRDASRSNFELKIVAHGQVLAAAKLRVASAEGEGRGQERDFSVDSLGRTRLDLEGLRGTRVGADEQPLPRLDFGELLEVSAAGSSADTTSDPTETVAGKFLDSLASIGSMGYGPARDQLYRLSGSVDPVPILMDLRARGHLEIQTDSKGHFVRIHSVRPTLFSLPATHDGLHAFGVAGSLRLHHWSAVLENSDFIPVLRSGSLPGGLPWICILATGEDAVASACSLMDFLFDRQPAAALANWSGSVVNASEALLACAGERFTAEMGHLHRLHSANARFIPSQDQRMSIDGETKRKLFRFDDPQAPGLAVYMLGSLDHDGVRRFAHVHDSRWGVWISILAFADMLLRTQGRDDACPWPVHYDAERRAVWLPARLRPPAVLERLLVLCSGRGPEVVRLTCGGREDDGLVLWDEESKAVIGNGSAVYDGFLPGLWLRYDWVPPEIAGRFAELLGGRLEPLFRTANGALSRTAIA